MLKKFLITSFCLGLNILFPLPIKAAEKINFVYSSLIFPLSIDSLEKFATTGEMTQDLKQYTSSLDKNTLAEIRIYLNKSYNFETVTLSKLTRTSLGEDLLKQLGKVISTHKDRNGFYAIRGAILTTANQKSFWTILDVLRSFPTDYIYVNLELLVQLKDDIFIYQSYREAVAKAIINQSNIEKEKEGILNLESLNNLSKKGKYNVTKETITLTREDLRQTKQGFVGEYNFEVDFYFPSNTEEKKPLILISHGFGSLRENFANLAEHLASYGFIVAIPQHVGSDLQYREELLKGTLSSALSPIEYIARPQDLSFIIDKLTLLASQDEKWRNRVDLDKIGAIGDSLGGTTVLSLAGAPLNIPQLKVECSQDQVIVNTSLILQCQGSHLPPLEYNLHDSRIKAVIATHPLTSGIFGSQSLSQIKIPIMITGGSNDVITPVVIEQIHPFIWLKSPFKHLLFYQSGTHFSSTKPAKEFTADYLPEILIGNNRDVTSNYFQGIAVAFMEKYLNNNQEFLPYLTASFAEFSKGKNLQINQITNLTPENIKQIYGDNLPLEIVPPLVVSFPLEDDYNSIIEEIKNTGILKVAYPQNNYPFGYVNNQGKWGGFCQFLTKELASYLETQLDLPFPLDIKVFPSNINNRFNLVKENQVHLECGSNIIREENNQVSFSLPFFVTGNYFLIPKTLTNKFNPNQSLENFKIGVLKNTNTDNFLQNKYPKTKPIYFEGIEGKKQEIEALKNNSIDAIMDTQISLENQLSSLNNSQDYQIVPTLPLNCDYYGLLLPKGDKQWIETINNFLTKASLTQKYFSSEIQSNLINNFNYCLNLNKE
ncbi:alpha/beta hydrolase [Geminocystis sp.]|uniref:alpha/beta hydrolase n=1 Tax=Geminocystis sp. TaxID=2664100 RepID=UPI0035933313